MKKWNEMTTKEKVLSILIPVVIIILLMIMILGKNDTEDTLNENLLSTEVVFNDTEVEIETEINVTETDIVETEVVESTEIESEVVEDTEIIVTDDNDDDIWYNGKPDVKKYMDTHEFVGFNENYKSVKGDPRYEIVDGCYKGVPLEGDTPETSWTYMVVWISPGGVEIKINDKNAYLATKEDIVGMSDAIWTKDPDKNLEPGSEWMIECEKFAYGVSGAEYERKKTGSVDLTTLPNVTTATEKRSSFNLTDEFKAYVEQYSILNNFQMSGMMEYNFVNQMSISEDTVFVWWDMTKKPWKIERENDYWKIIISNNLDELGWHGLKTCLKNIEPDAELVYDAIYEEAYHGTINNGTIEIEPDIWYNISDNTKFMYGHSKTEMWYYIK